MGRVERERQNYFLICFSWTLGKSGGINTKLLIVAIGVENRSSVSGNMRGQKKREAPHEGRYEN